MTSTEGAHALLEGQIAILELIARGAPLTTTLDEIVRMIESLAPGMLGSILLVDAARRLVRHGAGPSLPAEYMQAIDGVPIGPRAGSCGTAAYRGEPVWVEDIATDPLWEFYRDAALQYGLRACWSTPVFDVNRNVIGTFAMYYREPGLPDATHLRLIEVATATAAIAIERDRDLRALFEGRKVLRDVSEMARVGGWEFDVATGEGTWTEEVAKIHDLDPASTTNVAIGLDVYPEPDRGRIEAAIARAITDRVPYDLELEMITARGAHKWVRTIGHPVDVDGAVVKLRGTIQDITPRKLAEAERNHVYERIADGVVALDSNWRYVYLNRQGAQMLGREHPEDLVGRHIWTEFPEGENQPFARAYRQAMDEQRAITIEDCYVPWNRWFENRIYPSPTGLTIYFTDITGRKLAEEAAREREEQLRLFVEHSPAAIAMFDRDMRYLVASRRWLSDYRIADENIIGRSHYDVFPDLPARWREVHRNCLAGAIERCDEDPFPREDGRTDWVRWEARPWTRANGETGGIIIFSEVITERKEAELKVRESEERLRLAVQASNVGLWDWDLGTDHVSYSREWKGQLGYEEHEIGDDLSEWERRVHPDDLEPALERIRAYLDHPSGAHETEFRMRHKDGTYRWIYARAEVIEGNHGKAARMLGCHVDVTDRRNALEKLRESESHLRTVLDGLGPSMLVGLLSPDGVLLEANEPALRAANLTRDDVIGKPVWETAWFSRSSEAQQRLADAVGRARTGETVRYDEEVRGTGDETIVIDLSIHPLLDDQGRVRYLVPSAAEITGRKRAETALREAMESAQALSRRLVEVREEERRQLARELHDEIGQALTAMKINLQTLERYPGAANVSRFDESVALVDRALEQVRSLSLELRPPMLDDLGVAAALRWMADQQARLTGLRVNFVTDISTSRFDAAVETSCFRVAQEAVNNAVKHSGAETIDIDLLVAGGMLHLVVRDDGRGFDVDDARRRATEGAGLGLLSMQERALLAGGGIEWESSPGTGTKLHAWLAAGGAREGGHEK